ncbi:MAG: helix-turn-helix domain-containing protein [Rickettsiaceae bacterium]
MKDKEYNSIIDAIEAKIDKFFEMHEDKSPAPGLYARVVGEVEKVLIRKTLDHTNGIQVKASKILGVNRNTLRKKIKDLKL